MACSLNVRNFSCIKNAEIDVRPFTVLIGPQASGKSVISKLLYFSFEVLGHLFNDLVDGDSYVDHKKHVTELFKKWFPVSAWGPAPFRIKFIYNNFYIEFNRTRGRAAPSSNLKIEYPTEVEEIYQTFLDASSDQDIDRPATTATDFRERLVRRRQNASAFRRQLIELFDAPFTRWQYFIPAGRSFFTSQYRTTATLSNQDALDPLLVQFAHLYGFVRDSATDEARSASKPDRSRIATPIFKRLLGGEVSLSKDSQSLHTEDGRVLPFSFLSSGQQELLPLLLTTNLFGIMAGSTTYIEEPEAHLFPESQSVLLRYLVSMMAERDGSPQLFVTTHSPYMLARINNLIKAGQLGKDLSLKSKKRLSEIVPENAWIQPDLLAAYAIEEGSVRSILDQEGFVNADYLDNVSNDIARELQLLIQVEIDAYDMGG